MKTYNFSYPRVGEASVGRTRTNFTKIFGIKNQSSSYCAALFACDTDRHSAIQYITLTQRSAVETLWLVQWQTSRARITLYKLMHINPHTAKGW